MYINQFEFTGVPEFYAKGDSGRGEFYYIGRELLYFPYKPEEKTIELPKDEDGNYLSITAHCFLHSEELDELITCEDCGEHFEKKIGFTYFVVQSYHNSVSTIYLGEEVAPYPANGLVVGDVHSMKINESVHKSNDGKPKTYYVARIAIKDLTAPIGFSYTSVSSLHPFTVEKGDHLCAKGRLHTTQRCLNAICPHCHYVNTVVTDNTTLQASAVQSLNIPRSFFAEDVAGDYKKDTTITPRKHKK